ncbi:MAG: helix-turn-helix domain-containing protein [Candidatus Acidiferrales bacterium]
MTEDLGALFRKQLATLRDSKGLSQVKLSEMIGAGQQYVGQVEIGRIKTPPLKKLKKLASALNVSVGDLFFIDGLDDNPEVLRNRIHALAATNDVNQLRKFYRLMLVSLEKKSR